MSSFIYPKVRRDEAFVEELHGVKVADPYRWLEDPDSEETKVFVDAQDALTAEYIGSYQYRKNFHESLTEMYDFPRYGCPFKRGDFYYYFHNTGLQPQSILYQQTSLEAEPKVFFDPLTLEADGTAALRTHTFSKSGKYFAYGISRSGSDWTTVYVKPTSGPGSGPGEHSKDFVEWVKFSTLCFTHDDVGYFYNTLPKPENVGDKGTETNKNLNAKLCYHKLGTQQSEDILIYEDPENPEHLFSSVVSHDGRYILVEVTKDCDPVNKVWLIDLEKTNGKVTENLEFTKIFDNFDAEYDYIDNQGTLFYFKTNLNSPRYKIVRYDLAKPELGLIDLLPEHPVDVLYLGKVVNYDSLIVCYIHDVKHQLSLYQLSTGKFVKNVETLIGTLDSVAGRKEDTEFFVKFSGFLNPGVIYRYNFTDGSNSVFRETKVKGLNSDDLEVKQIFIESKDGTKVPIFIMSKKNIALDGNNPTIMYGYGGFSISIMPMFNSAWVTFVQHFNGILVVANIRGGAEYGEEWHKAGMLHNKQNVFDDFQAAAKWLINNKYTRPARLGITGGSNGGLLVGACINQTPQLFGAAVADVGVMDMLRFHKFTIGHAWKSDYGDPDKKEDFECLYKYSPLHNIQTKLPYPFVLLTTSDHDDRVVPLHSFKHIAQLQYLAKDNPNPLLIRIDKKAGHGMGKPTQKKIEEAVDKYTFIARALEVQWVD